MFTCATSGRRMEEIGELMRDGVRSGNLSTSVQQFRGTEPAVERDSDHDGLTYQWDAESTYIQEPPFFEDFSAEVGEMEDIHGARPLAIFGDSVTTDHISPAGAIKATSPAGVYLQQKRVDVARLQQLRLAARQSRSDGARHVRKRAHQEPDGAGD